MDIQLAQILGGTQVGNATPQPLGTAAAGTSNLASRQDHVHALPTPAAIGAAPATHTHIIADVTGLQTALDGKAATSHTHDASQIVSGTIDPARLPVFPSTVQIIATTIAGLTAGEQAQIGDGSLVTTTDGRRWVYTGTGSKTDEGSYIVLADITPDWSAISNRPTTLAGYGISDAAPLSHVGAGGSQHPNATTSVAGFMSGADKTKLDGIAAGATANTGTVTSVAVAIGTGMTVSGSPVTTSGTITLGLSANLQSWSGVAPSAYGALAANNTWTGTQRFNFATATFGAEAFNQGRVEVIGAGSGTQAGVLFVGYLNDAKTIAPIALGNRSAVLGGAFSSQGVLYSGSADPIDVLATGGANALRVNGNTVWNVGNLGTTVSGGNSNSYDQTSALLLRQWNASTNAPAAFYEMIHIPGAATAHALQIAYFGGDQQQYFIRHFNDQNGWGGTSATWRQLWHTGNFNPANYGALASTNTWALQQTFTQTPIFGVSSGTMAVGGQGAGQTSTYFRFDGTMASASAGVPGTYQTIWNAGNLLNIGTTAASARTALGLGTAATSNTGDFAAASHTHAASAITSGTFGIGLLPVATSGTSSSTQVVRADDSRLSDARTPLAHNHDAGAITTGTLPVARGGTGVTSSTGTGNNVLSASPTFTGTVNVADLTGSGNATFGGTYSSTGSNAAFVTWDRTGGFAQAWIWYCTGNIMRFFNNSVGDRLTLDTSGNLTATGNVTAFSDYRLKTIEAEVDIDLNLITAIAPVHYTRKDTGSESTGLIAQDLQTILPRLVQEHDDGMLSVDYGKAGTVLALVLARKLEDALKRIDDLERTLGSYSK